MAGINVKECIARLLDEKGCVQSSDVAKAAGISRQGAHYHLRAMTQAGELVREGAGRATRYRRAVAPAADREAKPAPVGEAEAAARGAATPTRLTYPLDGLEEDQAWSEAHRTSPSLAALPHLARQIAQYAFTELVNNAIEHSQGGRVEIVVEPTENGARVDIIDDGVGVFEHVRRSLNLASPLEAIQELHKGKTTTMPERHSGEGIFFVSKAVQWFELDSGGKRWVVDNQLGDMAVLETSQRAGTLARFHVGRDVVRSLRDVFDQYTRGYEFVRSRTVVKLFTIGTEFMSRSEARRLLRGLERFREVVLDFAGVQGTGQGFADEVFRVWASSHPDTKLLPVNMAEPVEFMVRRACREGG